MIFLSCKACFSRLCLGSRVGVRLELWLGDFDWGRAMVGAKHLGRVMTRFGAQDIAKVRAKVWVKVRAEANATARAEVGAKVRGRVWVIVTAWIIA